MLAAVGGAELVEIGRRAVRENRARAGRQDRSHIAPLSGQELGRGYRVDTAVDAVQTSAGDPLADLRTR